MNPTDNSISITRKTLIRIPFVKMMVSNIFVFVVTVFVGLCVEEMASNVLEHGRKRKNH